MIISRNESVLYAAITTNSAMMTSMTMTKMPQMASIVMIEMILKEQLRSGRNN